MFVDTTLWSCVLSYAHDMYPTLYSYSQFYAADTREACTHVA